MLNSENHGTLLNLCHSQISKLFQLPQLNLNKHWKTEINHNFKHMLISETEIQFRDNFLF